MTRKIRLCESSINALADAICSCTTSVDLSGVESLLSGLLDELGAINGNTDEIESLINDLLTTINVGNITLDSIISELQSILSEATAINLNTDGLEALISDLTAVFSAEFDETQALLDKLLKAQKFPVNLGYSCYELPDGSFEDLNTIAIFDPAGDTFTARYLNDEGLVIANAILTDPCNCPCIDCDPVDPPAAVMCYQTSGGIVWTDTNSDGTFEDSFGNTDTEANLLALGAVPCVNACLLQQADMLAATNTGGVADYTIPTSDPAVTITQTQLSGNQFNVVVPDTTSGITYMRYNFQGTQAGTRTIEWDFTQPVEDVRFCFYDLDLNSAETMGFRAYDATGNLIPWNPAWVENIGANVVDNGGGSFSGSTNGGFSIIPVNSVCFNVTDTIKRLEFDISKNATNAGNGRNFVISEPTFCVP